MRTEVGRMLCILLMSWGAIVCRPNAPLSSRGAAEKWFDPALSVSFSTRPLEKDTVS